MKNILLLIVFFLILPLNACKPAPKAEKRPLNLEETRFTAVAEDGYKMGLVVFSPEGMSAAHVAQKGDKRFVIIQTNNNGDKTSEKRGALYDNAVDLVFSPDGRRLAYIAKKAGKSFIVIDGKEGRQYDDAANPRFSPDSGLVAYEAKRNGKWYMAVGGKESPGADMHFMPPVFSPDSKMITYFEQHYKENKAFRVVSSIDSGNRKTGRDYDSTGAVVFSPDGSGVAYTAAKGGKFYVVQGDFTGKDERESAAYDLSPGYISFSPDNRKIAYFAQKNKKKYLVLDGKEVPLKYPVISPPVFSPDGSKIALVMRDKIGMQFVSLDNKTFPVYDAVSRPIFNPDGSLIAYAARVENEWHLAVNNKKGPAYDMVITPVFSPDGSRLAYRVRKNEKRFIVIADTQGNTIRQLPAYNLVWQPVFSPDGKHIAYGAAIQAGQEIWWKVEPVE